MLSNDINMNLLFIYIQSFTKLIFIAVSRIVPEPKIRRASDRNPRWYIYWVADEDN